MSKKARTAPMIGVALSMDRQERKPSDKHMLREHAKHSMRRATEDWVSGHMTTHEHAAIHKRAQHILSGKRPEAFRGKSGERKPKGLM
jgi:hypothetical protein